MKTMRPGVYASYTIMPVFTANQGKSIGIVARSEIYQESVRKITSISECKQLFGESGAMTEMIQAIYANGSPIIYGASAEDDSEASYREALEKLLKAEGPYIICTDSLQIEILQYLKQRISQLEEEGKEKIGICGAETAEKAVEYANLLNSRRMCISYPQMFSDTSLTNLSPAVLSVLISGEQDVTSNLNGKSAQGGFSLSEDCSEDQVNEMMQNGVCVFEKTGEYLELIRGSTTCTKNEEGEPDNTFRSLSVTLILDSVIPQLRNILEQRISKAKNTESSLNSIRSLLVCRLSDFKEAGLIGEYDMPNIVLSEEDSTVCIVSVAFTVVQGIQQVYLTAQISI